MSELLTPEEVQQYFKMKSVRTIYRWIEEGEFPNSLCIRGSYRIPKKDVEAFAVRHERKDDQPAKSITSRRMISPGQ